MKRLALLSVSMFIITNLIYSQDIINETGKDGKFIVRDAKQVQALVIEDGNVEIKGTLSIDSLAQGSEDNTVVVWSETDKQFKALYNLLPKSAINASVMAADSWTESGGDVYRASGNVGIGVATPIYPVTVYRSGANASVVTQRDGGAMNYINATATHGSFGTVNNFPTRIAQNGNIKMFIDKDNNGIYFGSTGNVTSSTDDDIDMAIDSDGNVGIGTSSPQNPLNVRTEYGGDIYTAAAIHNLSTGGAPSWRIGVSATCDYADAGMGGYFSGSEIGVYGLVYGNDAYLHKGVSGYVTPSLAYPPPVGSGTYWGVHGEAKSGNVNYGLYGKATGSTGTTSNYGVYATASGTGSNWAGYFDGNVEITGKIGVNVENFGDESQVKIKTATDDNFGVLVKANESGSEIGLHTSTSEYASLAKNCYFETDWKRFDTGGGAFIEQIEPNGDVVFQNVASGSNPISSWTGYMKLGTNGYLYMENPTGGYYSAATNNWVNGSSRTLKQDIIPDEMDVSKILEEVSIVNYRFKDEVKENPNASFHIGFIAEDTPKLLSGENQDGMVTGDCIGLLLAVVKEQQNAIKKLNKRIEYLESN